MSKERTQAIYFSRPAEGRTAPNLFAVALNPRATKRFSLTGQDYYKLYREAATWLAAETGLPPLDGAEELAKRYGLQLETRSLVTGWSPKGE